MSLGCATCPELSLDEWGDALIKPLGNKRYPLGCTLELTDRCNLACVHCYINRSAGDKAAQAAELTTAQILSILDTIADAGCLFLLLTGGEVLLRPDFAEIYRHARQRGMLVNIFTNGTLVTPEIADVLAESRPQAVEITLYGATAETHDAVTRVPGSFERCRRGIDLLLERRLPLSLKTVLLTINRHELAAMQALADQLGVEFRYDGMLWPRVDGGQQPYAYRLSVQEMLELDRADPQRQRDWDEVGERFSGLLIRSDMVYTCGAGHRTYHIDSMGRMCICTMSRYPSFDLQSMGFQEAWERVGALRLQRRRMETECRTCKVGGLCSQCPGWSRAVHGDDETPVEYVCELGRLRYAERQRADR